MVRTLADIAIQLDDEAEARDDMARADRIVE
jgi:hypothetical protein